MSGYWTVSSTSGVFCDGFLGGIEEGDFFGNFVFSFVIGEEIFLGFNGDIGDDIRCLTEENNRSNVLRCDVVDLF